MDTMKILLGATVAVLLVALAASWQAMETGKKNAPQDEIARLQKQITELRSEQDKLQIERRINDLNSGAAQAPVASDRELEALRERVAAQDEADRLKEIVERDKKVADQEELLIDQRKLDAKDPEFRRARMISEALLIGTVQEYVPDPQYGGFITFEVLMKDQVQPGVTVAIRRKTGILAQFKVSDVTNEGAVANPLPGFPDVQPEKGDQLILPPQY